VGEPRVSRIYITHGHGDHWFGLARLIQCFPGATGLATAEVLAQAADQRSEDHRGIPAIPAGLHPDGNRGDHAGDVVARTVERYPDWENLRTLWHSARSAIAHKNGYSG